jgi:Uma2 family endonuclease
MSATTVALGGLHGVCCLRLARRIGDFVADNGLGTAACNNTGFVTEARPDTPRVPDVSFWTTARLAKVPVDCVPAAPDLAVEVVSPHDLYGEVIRLIREYLENGVRMVWIVDPENRTVRVQRSLSEGLMLTAKELLDGSDVLPGFSCKVSDLFP